MTALRCRRPHRAGRHAAPATRRCPSRPAWRAAAAASTTPGDPRSPGRTRPRSRSKRKPARHPWPASPRRSCSWNEPDPAAGRDARAVPRALCRRTSPDRALSIGIPRTAYPGARRRDRVLSAAVPQRPGLARWSGTRGRPRQWATTNPGPEAASSRRRSRWRTSDPAGRRWRTSPAQPGPRNCGQTASAANVAGGLNPANRVATIIGRAWCIFMVLVSGASQQVPSAGRD